MHNTDPVEAVMANGLKAAGISFERDRELQPGQYSIDFYLPDYDLWIEVCQFHTPRKIDQMSRLKDVVLIQGVDASRAFVRLITRPGGHIE